MGKHYIIPTTTPSELLDELLSILISSPLFNRNARFPSVGYVFSQYPIRASKPLPKYKRTCGIQWVVNDGGYTGQFASQYDIDVEQGLYALRSHIHSQEKIVLIQSNKNARFFRTNKEFFIIVSTTPMGTEKILELAGEVCENIHCSGMLLFIITPSLTAEDDGWDTLSAIRKNFIEGV